MPEPVIVKTPEQFAELPERSVIALIGRDAQMSDWIDTHIYQKWGRDSWTEMDPSDRDDGEESWSSDSIIIIAIRDGLVPVVLFDPRDLTDAVDSALFAQRVFDGPEWATWAADKPGVEMLRAQRK